VVAGLILAVAGSLLAYAFFNLTAIVDSHQHKIINRVSTALGRAITVQKIQARAGWGISVELTGATIADDSAFSKHPFVAADTVSADLQFIPLLHGEIKGQRVALIKADFRY